MLPAKKPGAVFSDDKKKHRAGSGVVKVVAVMPALVSLNGVMVGSGRSSKSKVTTSARLNSEVRFRTAKASNESFQDNIGAHSTLVLSSVAIPAVSSKDRRETGIAWPENAGKAPEKNI